MPKNGTRARGRSGSPRSCPRCRDAEAAGDEDAVDAAEHALGPVALDLLGLDPADDDAASMGDAGVVERLVDRLVGVAGA